MAKNESGNDVIDREHNYLLDESNHLMAVILGGRSVEEVNDVAKKLIRDVELIPLRMRSASEILFLSLSTRWLASASVSIRSVNTSYVG